jgi:DNA-3-methyladenine glycosylase II
VRMLGGFSVSVGPRTVEEGGWRLRKAASLIKLLALAPGHRLQGLLMALTIKAPVGIRPRHQLLESRTVQAPGMGFAAGDAALDLSRAELPAGTRIQGSTIGIAGPGLTARFPAGNRLGNVLARAEAGVDYAPFLQLQESTVVIGEMLRLPPHRLLPAQSQPCEIFVNGALELRPAACDIDILNAQEEPTLEALGKIRIEQGRIGMAQMKPPVGTGSKSENGPRHGSLQGRKEHEAMTTLLETDAVLKRGLGELAKADPVMAGLAADGIVPELRKRQPGFEGLAWIVIGQQVSTASAAAIWARLRQILEPATPETFLGLSDESLRAAGLSAGKIRTIRAAATEISEGRLPLHRLHELSADEAHSLLTGVKGIGPWTADIYLLFCLGHPDAFPSGDLAVQEAARLAYGLEQRPDAKALTAIAERWRPWRGVAAKVLWAYYRVAKAREGVPG